MRWHASAAAFGLWACLTGSPFAAASSSEIDAAVEHAFHRAQVLCEADGSRLWGIDLCGPMLVADPATRRVVANQDGVLTPLRSTGALFLGTLPDDVPIANTAVDWNGRRWTMLMSPLPDAEPALSILLMHEAWHRVQREIGLGAVNADQDHLDTVEGRLWLRLELRALAAAVGATDTDAHAVALDDALAFRAWRRMRCAGAGPAEDALERHEGLAEYTGRVLAQDRGLVFHLVRDLQAADAVSEYARSFAYATGPAYGVLLDRHVPGWRRNWDRRGGLAELLPAAATRPTAALDATALERAGARYGIDGVRLEETARDVERQRAIAAWRRKLVDGPRLVLPVAGASFSFDPSRVTPLPPDGAVYGTIRVATAWGVLEVGESGLLSRDWQQLAVSRDGITHSADEIRGAGWMLRLAPGWGLSDAGPSGDWTLRRSDDAVARPAD